MQSSFVSRPCLITYALNLILDLLHIIMSGMGWSCKRFMVRQLKLCFCVHSIIMWDNRPVWADLPTRSLLHHPEISRHLNVVQTEATIQSSKDSMPGSMQLQQIGFQPLQMYASRFEVLHKTQFQMIDTIIGSLLIFTVVQQPIFSSYARHISYEKSCMHMSLHTLVTCSRAPSNLVPLKLFLTCTHPRLGCDWVDIKAVAVAGWKPLANARPFESCAKSWVKAILHCYVKHVAKVRVWYLLSFWFCCDRSCW